MNKANASKTEVVGSAGNIAGIVRKATVVKDEGGACWTFGNGKTINVGVNDLPDNVRDALLVHGLVQSVSDTYSGIKDVDEAWEAAAKKVEALLRGELTIKREGGNSLLAEALSNLSGKSVEEIKAKLQEGGEAAVKKVSKDVRVKAEMAKIQAERLAKQAEGQEDTFNF
jgi:hypothetical protein